jgi:hypothetical protein
MTTDPAWVSETELCSMTKWRLPPLLAKSAAAQGEGRCQGWLEDVAYTTVTATCSCLNLRTSMESCSGAFSALEDAGCKWCG